MNIKQLHQEGHSIRTIAELTGHSRNTVRRILREQKPAAFRTPSRASCLDEFKPYLQQRYGECRLSAVRLLKEIRAMGYTAGIDTLRRFLRSLPNYARRKDRMTVRFETPPGRQAQADWAYCGRFTNASGEQVAVYAFVMVLSFSRMLYVEFTTAMDLPTLISCHQHAFEYFGGWPQTILYDNMKQVRLGPGQWNPLFLDFVQHYGIVPKTHRVRRPRTKGKVERMVYYVKDNFLNGRSFTDLDDLNTQRWGWLAEANARLHATTGQAPQQLLASEQLTPLSSITPYQLCRRYDRKVDVEGFVRLGRSRYSVPPEYVGQRVLLELGEQRVLIRCRDLVIADHLPAPRPGDCMAQPEHVEAMWKLSLSRAADAPAQSWQLTWQDEVLHTPLAVYEEVM